MQFQTDEFESTAKIDPYIKEFRKVVAAEATKTLVAVCNSSVFDIKRKCFRRHIYLELPI